jgi:hypothetical protein
MRIPKWIIIILFLVLGWLSAGWIFQACNLLTYIFSQGISGPTESGYVFGAITMGVLLFFGWRWALKKYKEPVKQFA